MPTFRIARNVRPALPNKDVTHGNRSDRLAAVSEEVMSKHGHLPPIPAANHSQKGAGDHSETPAAELPKKARINPAEQGQTANIKQNTTTKGFFKGRRVK
jgi:hypothetical protein